MLFSLFQIFPIKQIYRSKTLAIIAYHLYENMCNTYDG